jgi:hypothetical protein
MTSWQVTGWNLSFTFWRQMVICSRQDIMLEDHITTSNKSFPNQSWTFVFQTCWPGKFSCLENCVTNKSTKLNLTQTIPNWNNACCFKELTNGYWWAKYVHASVNQLLQKSFTKALYYQNILLFHYQKRIQIKICIAVGGRHVNGVTLSIWW